MAKKKDYFTNAKAKCIIDPVTGCWNWQGKARHVQGYGFARHGGIMKTIQRGMAEELKLFPNIDFFSRITTSCNNKLCCRPSHIICMTHTEINYRRYKRHGTQGQFTDDDCLRVKHEYEDLEGTPRRVEQLSDTYNCSTSVIYRTIERGRNIEKEVEAFEPSDGVRSILAEIKKVQVTVK